MDKHIFSKLGVTLWIVTGLWLPLPMRATTSSCDKAFTSFLASPQEHTFAALDGGPCWANIGSSNVRLKKLNGLVEKGNPWAARYLSEHLKQLDGGNLEDSLIALGRFSDHDMEELLVLSSKNILTDRELKDALTMLPLSLSDDAHAQLKILNSRRNKVLHVTRKDLSRERSRALAAIDSFASEIKSHNGAGKQ